MGFQSKVALVTGAASAIGEAVAKELAGGGVTVVVADLEVAAAESVAAEVRSTGGNAVTCETDVADADSVERMIAFAVESLGRLDLAVNNAGIGGPSESTADYPLGAWRKVIDVNLNGVFYGVNYQIAAMLKSGGGSIVNMASILGTAGWAKASACLSVKHAIIGLTKTAAIEYAREGIRINAIGPAFIDTPLLSKNLEPDTLGQLGALHPVGRPGPPQEVSALTCFLLSDAAGFITGSYHLVDGGYTAR